MQDFETFEYSLVTKLDVKVKGYMTMTGKIRYNTPLKVNIAEITIAMTKKGKTRYKVGPLVLL